MNTHHYQGNRSAKKHCIFQSHRQPVKIELTSENVYLIEGVIINPDEQIYPCQIDQCIQNVQLFNYSGLQEKQVNHPYDHHGDGIEQSQSNLLALFEHAETKRLLGENVYKCNDRTGKGE